MRYNLHFVFYTCQGDYSPTILDTQTNVTLILKHFSEFQGKSKTFSILLLAKPKWFRLWKLCCFSNLVSGLECKLERLLSMDHDDLKISKML